MSPWLSHIHASKSFHKQHHHVFCVPLSKPKKQVPLRFKPVSFKTRHILTVGSSVYVQKTALILTLENLNLTCYRLSDNTDTNCLVWTVVWLVDFVNQTPDTHPSAVLSFAAWALQNVDITLALTGNAFQRHSGEPQLRAVSAEQTSININTNLWRTEISLHSLNLVRLCPVFKHTWHALTGSGRSVLKEGSHVWLHQRAICFFSLILSFLSCFFRALLVLGVSVALEDPKAEG